MAGRGQLLHWRGGQLLCGWGQLQGKQPQTPLRAGAGKGTGRAAGLLQALQVHASPTLRSPPETLDSTRRPAPRTSKETGQKPAPTSKGPGEPYTQQQGPQ